MNTLVAVTPTDLAPAQQSLLEWIAARVTALAAEFTEASNDLAYAKAHKWRTGPLTANVNRIAKRQTFYEKLKAAVEAGYVLMPSLQMSILAIRTRAQGPKDTTSNWNSSFEQPAQALPIGEGEYKNPVPTKDIVELMGHQRAAGRLTEEVIGGANMLRVDVPDGEDFRTAYYGASAIYALHITDEKIARGAAEQLRPTKIVEGREAKVHRMPPGEHRWKERSRTYQGIADAMAEQWGQLDKEDSWLTAT